MDLLTVNNKTLVIGGSGTIGKAFKEVLKKQKWDFFAPDHHYLDLLDFTKTHNKISDIQPKNIVCLMGKKTNISLCKDKRQGLTIFQDTLQAHLNLFKACEILSYSNVAPKKIITVISSCAYGEQDILKEQDFYKGNVHESIRAHGEAKKMVYLSGQMYSNLGKFNVVPICFNNICGGADWTRPDQLKVFDALVKRIVDAREENLPEVIVWGTGSPRREFLYHKDAADALFYILKGSVDTNLTNLGSGYDISIRDLANGIALAARYKGKIVFDTSKPDGQGKKLLDITKLNNNTYGWKQPMNMADMVDAVISDYETYRGTQK